MSRPLRIETSEGPVILTLLDGAEVMATTSEGELIQRVTLDPPEPCWYCTKFTIHAFFHQKAFEPYPVPLGAHCSLRCCERWRAGRVPEFRPRKPPRGARR